MTAIEVTARYAVALNRAGEARITDSATHSQIELVGVPVRGLTLAQIREPGRALSREKANDIREFAVTEAMPQKNCATHTISSRNSATAGEPSASRKIWAGGSPVSDAARAVRPASLRSGIAAVIE